MDWIKRITTFLTGIIVVLLLFSAVHSREVRDLFPDHPGALIYFSETLSEPRPVRLHFLSVDLRSKILEVVALTGEDPDGEGPAESQLTLPDILIKRFNAIAAVNANAFAALSDESGIRRFWYDGQPVDIHGMVVCCA